MRLGKPNLKQTSAYERRFGSLYRITICQGSDWIIAWNKAVSGGAPE